MTRRDDREYREYLREKQRSQRGCIAGRMQLEFHHGLLTPFQWTLVEVGTVMAACDRATNGSPWGPSRA